jgi:hypothetical protein
MRKRHAAADRVRQAARGGPPVSDALPARPWDRGPGEPPVWYNRFHGHYLLQPTERSVEAAFRD